MKSVNVAELKNRLSEYLTEVENGGEVLICKRNVPVAKIVSLATKKNRTQPGCGLGTGALLGKADEPLVPVSDWMALEAKDL
jgi:prevent-host-death family protein